MNRHPQKRIDFGPEPSHSMGQIVLRPERWAFPHQTSPTARDLDIQFDQGDAASIICVSQKTELLPYAASAFLSGTFVGRSSRRNAFKLNKDSTMLQHTPLHHGKLAT